MYPVDVVRALCMANPGVKVKDLAKGFFQSHGLFGFVKQGMLLEVCRASMARSAYFLVQPLAKERLLRAGFRDHCGTAGLAGAAAAFPDVITTSAMENMKLAQQLDKNKKFKGVADVAKHLVRTRGFFGGLFCGYFGMQMRGCLFVGGTFLSIDFCKDALRSRGVSNSLVVDILGGFMSGAFGVCLNCWTDVVRSVIQKKQIQASFDPKAARPSVLAPINPAPFFLEARTIMSSSGLKGLYAGVGPKMLHLGLSNSMMFVVIPRFKKLWMSYRGLQ